MVSGDDFVSGRIDYFNFIFTVTGSVRPAGYTLCLSTSVLTSMRWGEKRVWLMLGLVLCAWQPGRTAIIPRWSPSREFNSIFVKLMQKLPLDYCLSCISWPLRPIPCCSLQALDSVLAQSLWDFYGVSLSLSSTFCIQQRLGFSAVSLSIFFSALEKCTVCQEK